MSASGVLSALAIASLRIVQYLQKISHSLTVALVTLDISLRHISLAHFEIYLTYSLASASRFTSLHFTSLATDMPI